jgi:hypothetical protein
MAANRSAASEENGEMVNSTSKYFIRMLIFEAKLQKIGKILS